MTRHFVNSISAPVFQQIDIDEATDSTGIIVRLFGVTQVREEPTPRTPSNCMKQEGHSVLMNVTHFDPYFYIPCPRGFTSSDLEPFKNYMNVRSFNRSCIPRLNSLHRKFRGVTMSHEWNSSKNRLFGVIKEIPLSISSKSLRLTQETYPKFEISIFEAPLTLFPYLSTRVFERGQCSYQELFSAAVPTFESNIVYTLRFMIDTKVVGMNWIEVPAGNYSVVHAKKSKCQIEISVRYVNLNNNSCTCIQRGTDGTSSYLIRLKANGLRLLLSGYSVLISSVRVGRVSSRRPTRIQ